MKLLEPIKGSSAEIVCAITFINALMLDGQLEAMALKHGAVSVARASRAYSSNKVGGQILLRYTGPDLHLEDMVQQALYTAGHRGRIDTLNDGTTIFTPQPLI